VVEVTERLVDLPGAETALQVLFVAWDNDSQEDVFVRRWEGRIGTFVIVNDVFTWGSADAEEITDETLPQYLKAIDDIKEATGQRRAYDASILYASRIRGMRPQGAIYPHLDREIWPLIDACGPPREVGLGNPHKHPAEVES
jgi:hypothetical protein